ncbi:hypothetical protein ACFS2C_03350 [Prauserella oleivorans]|uniref:Secreted protein n=1 Tax=Prauserella oleivorans TaxID=1478153 RepID=A0ABW5W4K7_9PSEU
MPTEAIIAIIAVVVIVLAVAVALVVRRQARRRHLRERFGPEYDREVQSRSSTRDAERELERREAEHGDLTLRPLSADARERYTQSWNLIQQQFVDRPADAVVDADRLLTGLMADRGYPTDSRERQASALSVTHAETMGHYRAAHDIVERHRLGQASTEDLREAMVGFRTVFDQLVRPDSEQGPGPETVPRRQPGV